METKAGKHTAKSGLFLREYPGRLVLLPIEAATCCVIFFGGDWTDGGIAAICGLVSGLIDWVCGNPALVGETGKIVIDVLVGIATVS